MNILFLALDVDLGVPRGESVHVRELTRNWAALGHSVRLVTAGGAASMAERNVRAGSTFSQILQGRRLARRWADVIYERRLSPKVSWAASALTGVPFVVEVNGVLEDELRWTGRAASDSSLRRLFRRRMFQAASRIVAVSRGIHDDVVARYALDPHKVEVIPNGANTDLFRPQDLAACRKELRIPADARIVCFTGNLIPWQGVDLLVRACAAVRHEVPRLELLLVGGGEALGELRLLASNLRIAEAVRFAGPVPYEKVPTFVNAADACVAPFRKGRKASPIKVFEYLACGKPVVASDADEIGDFVRSCSGGIVVPPDDEAALVDALQQLLHDPVRARAMGDRGREAVLRTASWRATAQRVAAVLQAEG